MNRITNTLLLILLSMSLLISCQKDTLNQDKLNFENEMIIIDEEGALNFHSHDQYIKTYKKIRDLTKEELIQWERSNNFQSYIRTKDVAWEALNNTTNPEELNQVMKLYKNYFKVSEINGETHFDDAYEETFLLRLCNKDGYFIVDNKILRIIDDYYIKTDISNKELVLAIKYDDIKLYLNNSEITAVKYIETIYESTKSTTTDITAHNAVNGNREAWINVKCTRNYFEWPDLSSPDPSAIIPRTRFNSRIHAWGKKRIWFGWTKYTTNVTIAGCGSDPNIIMQVPYILESDLNFETNIPYKTEYTRDLYHNILSGEREGTHSGAFNFTKIDVKTKTTGTNNWWATINF